MAEEKEELIPINIGNINDGAVIDMFDRELQSALKNINDLSTPATATRSITIRLDLKPHSDRCVIETTVSCSTKLAGVEKHNSKVFMGRTEDNSVIAFASDPRQMAFWTAPKPREEAPVIQFRAESQQQ
jgi:hypothetical protein